MSILNLDPRNQVGRRFDHLEILNYIETTPTGRHVFTCKCDCGNESVRTSQYLNSKVTHSCGCMDYPELIGQKFNQLTVLKFAGFNKDGRHLYLCECDCGNKSTVALKALKKGTTKSCGCAGRLNLAGKKYGRLTVVEQDGYDHNQQSLWKCKCDCGNEVTLLGHRVKSGNTKSCGCLKVDRAIEQSKLNIIHGASHSRLYGIWKQIKQRCYNSEASGYEYYGGKGVRMCAEWKDDFSEFQKWSILNGYSDELSIDRIDGDGNYEPNNCRWATCLEQSRNLSTTLMYHGVSVNDLAEQRGLNVNTVHSRIIRGMSIEDALSLPMHYNKPKYGDNKTLTQICNEHGVDYELVRSRLRSGWDLFDALDKPKRYTVLEKAKLQKLSKQSK